MTWSARRHLGFMLRHANPRRALNAALCLAEMSAGRAILLSHPFYLRVNVSEVCNLRCPGCLVRRPAWAGDAPAAAMMSFDLFEKSVHDFLPFLLKVNLYDEGEPLLNPEVFRMVRHLRERGVGACMSSNFSLPLSEDRLEALLHCGLEHLIVSVDGATQETYERYRVGGRLDLVLSNLRRLIALQRSTPRTVRRHRGKQSSRLARNGFPGQRGRSPQARLLPDLGQCAYFHQRRPVGVRLRRRPRRRAARLGMGLPHRQSQEPSASRSPASLLPPGRPSLGAGLPGVQSLSKQRPGK
jgi:hypothetical protein